MPYDDRTTWSWANAGATGDQPRSVGRGSAGSAATAVGWRVADRCVLLESNETTTVREWTAALEAAVADDAFEPGMSVVHDTRSRLAAPDAIEVREGVSVVVSRARIWTIRRWALVARTGAHYGMARMAQILSDLERPPAPELRAFQDPEEAIAWARGRERATEA